MAAPAPPLSAPPPYDSAADCALADAAPYNLPLGIASIFIVAVVSFAGFLAPSLIRKAGRHARIAVVSASAMGTGVILAVALVHIASDASEALSSPCLPQAWLDAFPDWGMLFMTVTMVGMIVLDYVLQGVFERKYESKRLEVAAAASSSAAALSRASTGDTTAARSAFAGASGPSALAPRTRSAIVPTAHGLVPAASTALVSTGLAMHGAASALAHFEYDLELLDERGVAAFASAPPPPASDVEAAAAAAAKKKKHDDDDGDMFGHNHGGGGHGGEDHAGGAGADGEVLSEAELTLKRGAVVFIEASVCTHSIPVGLALGLQPASTFTALFIAVIVHQLLEGMGVGAAAMDAQYRGKKLFMLATAFSLTAPIGIALGVGLHDIVSEKDPRYLFSLGLVNAIAAGMLLYVALQHMNCLANQGAWLRKQHSVSQALAIICFCIGAAALIAIGKFA
jgi:zinc transporter 1/2/3